MEIKVSPAPVQKEQPRRQGNNQKKPPQKFIHPRPERQPLTPEQKARRDAWMKRKAEREQKRREEKIEATRVGSLKTQHWSNDQIQHMTGSELLKAYCEAQETARVLGATTDHHGDSTCVDVVALKKVIIKRAKKNKWDGTGDPAAFYEKVLDEKTKAAAAS